MFVNKLLFHVFNSLLFIFSGGYTLTCFFCLFEGGAFTLESSPEEFSCWANFLAPWHHKQPVPLPSVLHAFMEC